MLESRPRAGTRVRIPSREDVNGHYLVREILEAEAARRFAAHATKAERTGLMRMGAKVDALASRKDRGPYLALHHRLHSRIAECARCRALSNVIEQTCALSSTWFCLLLSPEAPLTTRRHRELTKAVATLRPDEAAEFMREHVRYSHREARASAAVLQDAQDTGRDVLPQRARASPAAETRRFETWPGLTGVCRGASC